MKTVIADNSLCVNTLSDSATGDDIFSYIEMLAAAGVKYVELDFRAAMKLKRLPEGIGYIFRMVDPMFLRLTEVFDFDYILINFPDLKKRISTKVPIMLELPVVESLPGRAVRFAQTLIDGKISLLRLCGKFDFSSAEEASGYLCRLKNDVAVPVDFCPLNTYKNAVDSAIKLALANADSITLSMGSGGKYAAFEDFLFTLISVYDAIPAELNAGAMCRASVFGNYIFGNTRADKVMQLMEVLDSDIRMLKNADTGGEVKTRIRLKDTQFLRQAYVSAVEKMLKNEELENDISEELAKAVGKSEASVFSNDILNEKRRGLLN